MKESKLPTFLQRLDLQPLQPVTLYVILRRRTRWSALIPLSYAFDFTSSNRLLSTMKGVSNHL